MEHLVEKAIELGIKPKALYISLTQRLEQISKDMPPRQVLYNSCYGSFQYSKHFIEFFQDPIPEERDDENVINAVKEFGTLNASLYPRAFAAFVIYDMYNFNNLVETANIFMYNPNEMILEHRVPSEMLDFFKTEFFPAYKEYKKQKRIDYYEHDELVNSFMKNSNSAASWCAAPEYQRFGMSYIYKNDLIIKDDFIYDPITKEYVEILDNYKLEFGLLCASGTCSNIKIKEVPALVDWNISQTDGLETVSW